MYGEQPAYGRLVEIAVSSTAVFVGLATIITNKVYVNGLLLLIVSLALLIYNLSLEIAPLDTFTHLYSLVFVSSSTRNCLLIFWLFNVLVSIAFGIVVNLQGKSTTIHRKFFHLTVSLIYVSGLYLDISFTWLCGWLWLCIFVIIEIFRYFEVPPWSESLNNFLLPFKDEQDTHFLLTPIFLLLGVFMPLFLSPSTKFPQLHHFAGVASVGVGDSLAAIIGSQFGVHKWPGRKKTMEGSLAMLVGCFFVLLSARPFCTFPASSPFTCLLVSLALSLVEAFTSNIDNLLLPFLGFFML